MGVRPRLKCPASPSMPVRSQASPPSVVRPMSSFSRSSAARMWVAVLVSRCGRVVARWEAPTFVVARKQRGAMSRICRVALVFSPSAVYPRGMASGLNAIIDDRAISTSVAVSAKPTRGGRVLSREAVAGMRSGRRRQCPGKGVSTWRTPSILLKPRGILPTRAEQKHAGRRPHTGITNDFESSRLVGPRLMLGRSATTSQ